MGKKGGFKVFGYHFNASSSMAAWFNASNQPHCLLRRLDKKMITKNHWCIAF
jgi:hypothetical protein